jgi:hypothetical protein
MEHLVEWELAGETEALQRHFVHHKCTGNEHEPANKRLSCDTASASNLTEEKHCLWMPELCPEKKIVTFKWRNDVRHELELAHPVSRSIWTLWKAGRMDEYMDWHNHR